MANKKRVYWDSCNWIGLIMEEENKIGRLRYVIELAKRKELEILSSTFTLAEVFKLKCEDAEKELPEEKDQLFEDFMGQDFVVYAAVTEDIGKLGRRLLRKLDGLKKPQDAIHLATAAWHNVDEMHTFDREHLIPFDNRVTRRDGQKLKICFPPEQLAGLPLLATSSVPLPPVPPSVSSTVEVLTAENEHGAPVPDLAPKEEQPVAEQENHQEHVVEETTKREEDIIT